MGAGTKAAAVQPRPKKLYREKDERPAVGIKASAKHAMARQEHERAAALSGPTGAPSDAPLA